MWRCIYCLSIKYAALYPIYGSTVNSFYLLLVVLFKNNLPLQQFVVICSLDFNRTLKQLDGCCYGRQERLWRRPCQGQGGCGQKNAAELAAALKVSPQAVSKWESGESFPSVKRWSSIKIITGIDPAEYRDYSASHTSATDNSNNTGQLFAAIDRSNISVHPDVNLHEPAIPTELSAREWEAMQALRSIGEKGLEAVILFERFGNNFLLERCLAGLIEQRDKWVNTPTHL